MKYPQLGPCVQVMFPSTSQAIEHHYYFENVNMKKNGDKITVSYKDAVPSWSHACYADKDRVNFDQTTLYSDGHKISFPESCPIVKGKIFVGGSTWHVDRFDSYYVVLSDGKKDLQFALYADIKCVGGKASVSSEKLFPISDLLRDMQNLAVSWGPDSI